MGVMAFKGVLWCINSHPVQLTLSIGKVYGFAWRSFVPLYAPIGAMG